MSKKIEKLADTKAPYEEFSMFFNSIEKDHILIDKLDIYKQNIKEFLQWEHELVKALEAREPLEVIFFLIV